MADPARELAASLNKRDLVDQLLALRHQRDIYQQALREIARWDGHRTLGYEGPKRVAQAALAAPSAGSTDAGEARP